MSTEDGKRLWRAHQRFAEYEDLRDLYKRCLPEIQNFEKKILDHETDLQQFQSIIANFDKVIAQKAEKTSIRKIYNYCDETFQQRGS